VAVSTVGDLDACVGSLVVPSDGCRIAIGGCAEVVGARWDARSVRGVAEIGGAEMAQAQAADVHLHLDALGFAKCDLERDGDVVAGVDLPGDRDGQRVQEGRVPSDHDRSAIRLVLGEDLFDRHRRPVAPLDKGVFHARFREVGRERNVEQAVERLVDDSVLFAPFREEVEIDHRDRCAPSRVGHGLHGALREGGHDEADHVVAREVVARRLRLADALRGEPAILVPRALRRLRRVAVAREQEATSRGQVAFDLDQMPSGNRHESDPLSAHRTLGCWWV